MLHRWRNWLGRKLPAIGSCFFDSILWEFPARLNEDGLSRGERPAALTFDDGPHPESTPQILKLLARKNLLATFFVCGERAEAHPELVHAIIDHGHQLGNHSYSHPDAWKLPSTQIIADLDRSAAVIEQISGQSLLWYRPPYGHFTMATIRWARRSRQRIVMWNHLPPDYDSRLPHAEIIRLGRSALPQYPLICLHDNAATAEAGRCDAVLAPLIDDWLEAGLQFCLLPQEAAFRQSLSAPEMTVEPGGETT
ncbi:polysaccharide deacetylase family protein [Planctopirus hydrillae]|uniref:NodB homology domain-containing protein n=1 Tax=Planctopirus hydrillae TaxID=1841610 RepID=A0A1C3E830_9PLAN|nr:polysaccharide deacetylase family protein [Planctopirus hydrillae]ODA29417.1 hypothetical protein A6X21_08995 [Planctopirus hydrillae]